MVREWLALEGERPPFAVEAVEERKEVSIAGLGVRIKIDRIDRLDAGERLVIDYKSGLPQNVNALLGERPDAPQLPLYGYALAGAEAPAALAFGYLRKGETKALGIARNGAFWSQLTPVEKLRAKSGIGTWPELQAALRDALEGLARDFAGGEGSVAPKYPRSCEWCDQQPLCRVRELAASSEGNGSDAD